jgi:hypothetical protein
LPAPRRAAEPKGSEWVRAATAETGALTRVIGEDGREAVETDDASEMWSECSRLYLKQGD